MTTRHFCDYCGEEINTVRPVDIGTLVMRKDTETYRLQHICDPCIGRIKAQAPIRLRDGPEYLTGDISSVTGDPRT